MLLLDEMESLWKELHIDIPKNIDLAEMGATLQYETTIFQEAAVSEYEDEMLLIDRRKEGIENRLTEIRAEIARLRPELSFTERSEVAA